MTSGKFTTFPIDQIFVDRAKRQRKAINPEAVASLASSISAIGLINPLTVERSGELRTGETRLAAVRSLGWTHVPVQFVEDLSESELQLVELDENIKRTNLTWQEEAEAVARYHSLRGKLEPDWTMERTAQAIGLSTSGVEQRIAVHKEMQKPESRVHQATKFSEARNIVARTQSRAAASVLEELEFEVPKDERPVPLINADFNQWINTYEGPQFNFIHCDFPYGINADNQQQGSNVTVMGTYEDSADVYFQLLDTLAASMDTIVAPSAHLIFWYSMKFHNTTFLKLTEMGWDVNPFPLIWHKSDNVGLLPDPQRGPRRTYESAFFASRGDRKIVQAVANSYSGPTTKKIHMSEKPLHMLAHFFRMAIDEYSIVLDPTCGSANAIRQATRMGAKGCLGIERDPEFYQLAKEAFHDDD